jgi:predicted enzyme related to lactoylglutathione lyase
VAAILTEYTRTGAAMTEIPRTYPQGVTSWIDTGQPDPEAAGRFYGELFGWEFSNAAPPGTPAYLIAQLDGEDAAAIAAGPGPARWNTYIAVTDADQTALAIADAGGAVLAQPADAGPAGRTATCADPQGARFRLWQAGRRIGVQAVNRPGSWNFSDIRTTDPAGAREFYTGLFGWRYLDLGETVESMIAVPGYGDHLAATVLSREDQVWALLADIRDPQGAEFTISEFREAG